MYRSDTLYIRYTTAQQYGGRINYVRRIGLTTEFVQLQLKRILHGPGPLVHELIIAIE